MSLVLKGRICNACKQEIEREILEKTYDICPNCGNYLRMHAPKRIKFLADKDSFKEWDTDLQLENKIDESYEKKLKNEADKSGISEAVVTGRIKIKGQDVAIGVMDTRFMMASMGQIVGEKITRLFEKAIEEKLPVIIFCCSGGARMQEGIISLMQMVKTSAAVKRHSDNGLLYISVLTNPTMGGVTGSFAPLADIVLAEKGAMIGFAGPRVIEQNTGKKLPEGFQTAQFQKEHGLVDAIITREKMKDTLSELLFMHGNRKRIKFMMKKEKENKQNINKSMPEYTSSWNKVQIARGMERPTSRDYIEKLFDDFYELCGDRIENDDKAIVSGIAKFHDSYVTVIGHQKGKKSIEDALEHNFGMPSPSGYRKALRLMKQAEKFNRPIIFFVDTIGAGCGEEAESRGQGIAIANMLEAASAIKVPVLSIIISEGGSGGALALGVGNEVWILENAVYSVLTPEAYASIIYRDSSRAKEAAQEMKMQASDLLMLKVADKIIPEPEPVTRDNMDAVCDSLDYELQLFLEKYEKASPELLAQGRYERFRNY